MTAKKAQPRKVRVKDHYKWAITWDGHMSSLPAAWKRTGTFRKLPDGRLEILGTDTGVGPTIAYIGDEVLEDPDGPHFFRLPHARFQRRYEYVDESE